MRRDRDDVAAALGLHPLERLAGAQERADDVGVEHRAQVGDRRGVDRREAAGAGRAHHDVRRRAARRSAP
jgi:hypothetical protein